MSDLYCGSRASDLARVEVNINTKEDGQDPTSNEAPNYVRDREITMAAKFKLETRNWKGRSAIYWQSRFKTSAVYKREGLAWP